MLGRECVCSARYHVPVSLAVLYADIPYMGRLLSFHVTMTVHKVHSTAVGREGPLWRSIPYSWQHFLIPVGALNSELGKDTRSIRKTIVWRVFRIIMTALINPPGYLLAHRRVIDKRYPFDSIESNRPTRTPLTWCAPSLLSFRHK